MSRNSHFGHDDRTEVNYRLPGRRQRKQKSRFGPPRFHPGPGGRPRYEDLEGDVEMSAPSASRNPERRFNPYKPNNNNKKGKNGRIHANNYSNRVLSHAIQHGGNLGGSNRDTWFKIVIPYGRKLDRNFILKSIASTCRTGFIPFNFQYDKTAAIFFVNDSHAAQSIKDVSRQILTPDGFKMFIQIVRGRHPVGIINAEVTEAIKACMSRHYDVSTHSLDLSKFHHDPGLKESGLYIPLYQSVILRAVINIIKENIPEIQRLDLSQNGLTALETLSNLVLVCTNLTALNLRGNKLKTISVLNSLKGLNLVEINLDENPLCDDFKDQASYISAVRKRLPKIVQLDGLALPPPITFDLGAETVPASRGSYFPAQDVKNLVLQFLETYYSYYDSGDREKLLDAYHENASFSMTVVKPNSQKTSEVRLQEYFPVSRNLLRITDSTFRNKLLKQGRLSVVSALAALPKTQHDPNSFTIDISLVLPFLMSFTICGVFKEVGGEYDNAPLRSFSRSFVVVAQNSGFVISNETLSITNASVDQVKAFRSAPPTPSPSPAPSSDKTVEEKQLMATTFSNETGMNLDYSVKCLDEYDWDYHKAAAVFSELHGLGRIPPEAFVK